MQVIAITHLPQMASRGRFHFHVYKEDSEHQTFTRMKALNDEEKLMEVARMISGNKPGESAIANARELLRG
jgi:DNA repair protein RecN (Recombination protein N)